MTGATGVWVFEPNGEWLGVIATPEGPANCAWGDADRQSLYITACKVAVSRADKSAGIAGVALIRSWIRPPGSYTARTVSRA